MCSHIPALRKKQDLGVKLSKAAPLHSFLERSSNCGGYTLYLLNCNTLFESLRFKICFDKQFVWPLQTINNSVSPQMAFCNE